MAALFLPRGGNPPTQRTNAAFLISPASASEKALASHLTQEYNMAPTSKLGALGMLLFTSTCWKKPQRQLCLQTLVIALFWVLRTGLTLEVILSQPASKFLSKWIIRMSKPTKFPWWCPPRGSESHIGLVSKWPLSTLPNNHKSAKVQIVFPFWRSSHHFSHLFVPLFFFFFVQFSASMALEHFWEKERENFGCLFEFYESAWQLMGKALSWSNSNSSRGYIKMFLFFSIKTRAKHFRLTHTICLTWNKVIHIIFGGLKLLVCLLLFRIESIKTKTF